MIEKPMTSNERTVKKRDPTIDAMYRVVCVCVDVAGRSMPCGPAI